MRVELFTTSSALPPLIEGNPFHSAWMFSLIEEHTEARPLMLVAYDDEEGELGHLLAVRNRELRLFPPGLHTWYSIYGEGVYSQKCESKQEIFDLLLKKLYTLFDFTHTMIEVRNLGNQSFAYETLSKMNFFPRRDIRVYLSLHSNHHTKRISRTYRTYIRKAQSRGVTFSLATDPEEIVSVLKLLRLYYISKIKRHLPPLPYLKALLIDDGGKLSSRARMFVVRYKGRPIGCSICLYEQGRAHLAYSFGQRKSHPLLYPGIMAVWAAITDAHSRGIDHFEFLELSGTGSGYRNFILNFGGKQISTYHWQHYKWGWINKFMRQIYV